MLFMSSGENGNLSVGGPWFNLCHCNCKLLFSCTSKSNYVLTFFLYYPGKHTIFGRVCRGMEVIKRLGSVQTDQDDRSEFSYTLLFFFWGHLFHISQLYELYFNFDFGVICMVSLIEYGALTSNHLIGTSFKP